MKLWHRPHIWLAALALAIGNFAAAPPAFAQIATGSISATCTIGGAPAELVAQYEVYGDHAVFTERTTGRFADIVTSGLTTTYWKGYLNTAFGRFTISGENRFVEAFPVGGYYSDKRTLEIISTGESSFMLRDFFADNQPTFPCQITQQQ